MDLDLSGISLPFTVTDLVTSGSALLGLVAGFVLLGLAFKLVPKLIGLFKNSFSGGNK
ncbi:hypothetical protein [Sporolactobacillus terrae]|uniref:hypothetical protein n=1 Tax=Sporolactobacillus terrae TaxID=269673 RepID=UPI000B2B2B6B|nr:hypothetical protein [Sporolactobacillus terrae]